MSESNGCCLNATVGELLELIGELRAVLHRAPCPVRFNESDGVAHIPALIDLEALPHRTDRVSPPHLATHAVSMRRQGECWILTCDDDTRFFTDIKGMGYLDYLRRHPGTEFSPGELRIASEGIDPTLCSRPKLPENECAFRAQIQGSTGPLIDCTARITLRRRIEELQQEEADAERCADGPRGLCARAEREKIEDFVRNQTGFRGRQRIAASAAEKDRSTVTKAIRTAIQRIRGHLPTLGEHLDIRVLTGRYCRYIPTATDHFVWID